MTEITQWPDDVRRVSNEMTLHSLAGAKGKWLAFSMADGRPLDHVPYDTWGDAVRAAKWDRDNYMFMQVTPDGMGPAEASAMLGYARSLSRAGFRVPGPDWEGGELSSFRPATAHDRRRMARQLITGRKLPDQTNNPADIRRNR